jgi:hypothetical protein
MWPHGDPRHHSRPLEGSDADDGDHLRLLPSTRARVHYLELSEDDGCPCRATHWCHVWSAASPEWQPNSDIAAANRGGHALPTSADPPPSGEYRNDNL